MAILGTKNPTLLDLSKAMGPDGQIVTDIVEAMNQTNEILTDMTVIQGNTTTGNISSIRTGLPDAIWRKLYQGVPTSKSTRVQVTDNCGMLAARSEVDCKLAEMSGNIAAFRNSEAMAFLETMNQTMATTTFYGDTDVNPERFMGLAPRYSSKSAANGRNIIDCGGTGADNTSIWLVVWGPQTCHGIVPKASGAGIKHKDLDEIDCFDANNNRYRGYAETWDWDLGLTLKDWRYVVRIANIDVSELEAETNAADLLKAMVKARHHIPQMGMGRPVFYVNRTVAQFLDVQSLEGARNTVISSGNDAFGNPVTTCRGIPIRTVDALLETEEAVV